MGDLETSFDEFEKVSKRDDFFIFQETTIDISNIEIYIILLMCRGLSKSDKLWLIKKIYSCLNENINNTVLFNLILNRINIYSYDSYHRTSNYSETYCETFDELNVRKIKLNVNNKERIFY